MVLVEALKAIVDVDWSSEGISQSKGNFAWRRSIFSIIIS